MRKSIIYLLILVLALSFTACKKTPQEVPQEPQETEEQTESKIPTISEEEFNFGDFSIKPEGYEFSNKEDMSSGEYINVSYDYRKESYLLNVMFGDTSWSQNDLKYLLDNLGAKQATYNDVSGYESMSDEICVFVFQANEHTWMISSNSKQEFQNIVNTIKIN